MKRLEGDEDELVGRIPDVLRVRPVAIEPLAILIAFDVEDVRVAVSIGENICRVPSESPVLESFRRKMRPIHSRT